MFDPRNGDSVTDPPNEDVSIGVDCWASGAGTSEGVVEDAGAGAIAVAAAGLLVLAAATVEAATFWALVRPRGFFEAVVVAFPPPLLLPLGADPLAWREEAAIIVVEDEAAGVRPPVLLVAPMGESTSW